jgi:signal transduction histidine kinase
LLVFFISMLLLIVMAILSSYSLKRLVDSAYWVNHTQIVMTDLETINSVVRDAESSQRGFLLTGNKEYLLPYHNAYKNAFDVLEHLKGLTKGDAEAQQKLELLKTEIDKRFSILKTALKSFEDGEPIDKEFLNDGRLQMIKVSKVIEELKAEQHGLLTRRTAVNAEFEKFTPVYTIVFSLFAIFVGTVACLQIFKNFEEVKAAEQEVHSKNSELQVALEELKSTEEHLIRLNNELERRVDSRTNELSASEEELRQTLENLIDLNSKITASERELVTKNEQLLKINNELDNFIYTASHDLKAPISNIEGLASNLKKRLKQKIDQDEEKLIEMIEQSVNRFKNTIDSLTEISKIQQVGTDVTEEVLFEEILEEINIDLAYSLEQVGGCLIKNLIVDRIHFSRKNLRSILFNLLSNSIKYRSSERSLLINFSTFLSDEYTVICVQDNGLGIPNDQIPKVFTMFKRFHTHTDGSGVGLYIVKKIIENVNGKIEVESEVGGGSTFKIFIRNEEN